MCDKNVILVGTKRICNQIAYVFNIKEYSILENITDIEKYEDDTIIICKKIKNKKKIKNNNVYSLKELYKYLDKEYKEKFALNRNNVRNIIRPTFTNKRIIDKIPVELLKPSELLIKVINSKGYDISCNNLENSCNIDYEGFIWGCCPTWIRIPFGNINKENSYNNHIARIIKLSSLNKSYCLCDLSKCKFNNANIKETNIGTLKTDNYPKELTIAIDKTCNLKCQSCRKSRYKATKEENQKIEEIKDKLINTGWLEKSDIIIAGQGEVFFSEHYKNILKTDIKRNKITILSNGTLFNEKNWKLLENKYKEINVQISIDAATEETYKKLRCGNFKSLIKNLEMLGNLRKEEKIQNLQFNFVVQKDNYKEMIKFIEMGKSFNADKILFTKLNNWGTYSKKEYLEKCLIIDKKYLNNDLYKTIQNPIFKEMEVDLTTFENYISASKKLYGDKK